MIRIRILFHLWLALVLFTDPSATFSSPAWAHQLEKRQIGVLARTGALPQGKRSLRVFGDLPDRRNEADSQLEAFYLGGLEDPDPAEVLAGMPEDIAEHWNAGRGPLGGSRIRKRTATDGRTGSRSGYLVRRPSSSTGTQQIPADDILDPDDFLAEIRFQNLIELNPDERATQSANCLPPEKTSRILAAAKNLMFAGSSPENEQSPKRGRPKKNLASLAKDGGLASFRRPSNREPNWYGRFDFVGFREGQSIGGNEDIDGERVNSVLRNTNSRTSDGSEDRVPVAPGTPEGPLPMSPPSPQDDPLPDDREDVPAEKRFLGRIPQLGRTHQKVQTPSARRRPHLRPNWL